MASVEKFLCFPTVAVLTKRYCWTVAAAANTNNVNSHVTVTSGPTAVFLPAPCVSSITTR